jgi:RNA polymerase sigma-70 factor, ECF subfamily
MIKRSIERENMVLDTFHAHSDAEWVAALKNGDERAFAALIETYHTQMIRVATAFVSDPAVAEEVVQETWIGLLRGIGRFEGRSSLKTWVFSILLNKAKSIAKREVRHRHVTIYEEGASTASSVPPSRFHPAGHPEAGHWAIKPQNWNNLPEEQILSQETLAYLQAAILELPANQREVLVLRDVEGWDTADVCNVLNISETNQRVLLHRARSKVRAMLEDYLKVSDE